MTFLPQFVLYEFSVVEDSKYSYAIHTYKFKDWRGVTTLKNQKKLTFFPPKYTLMFHCVNNY